MRERDYISQVEKNPLLAYIMLHVIDKFQPHTYVAPEILAQLCTPTSKDEIHRRVLTPQRFYRILYLINSSCQKRGLDLRLPYYWYKSGPVVHVADAPRVFKITRVQKTQLAVASFAEWKETILVFDGFESAYSDAILLTANARPLGDLSKLDVIYEYSPSHTHKILITLLNELSHYQKNNVLEKPQKEVLQGLLTRLILEAWDSKYDELYPLFARRAELLRYMLGDNITAGALNEDAIALWDIFMLALRSKENANIDVKIKRRWEESYHKALNNLRKRIASERKV